MQQQSVGLAMVGAGVIFSNHAFAAAQVAPQLRLVGWPISCRPRCHDPYYLVNRP